MKKITISTIVLVWLDVAFTGYFIYKFGLEIEANPLGRFLFERPLLLFIVKIITSILIVLISKTKYKISKIGLWVILISYFFIVIYHIFLTVKVLSIFY